MPHGIGKISISEFVLLMPEWMEAMVNEQWRETQTKGGH